MQRSVILSAASSATSVLLTAGAIAWQKPDRNPSLSNLPPPYATPAANNPPDVISKPANSELHVPSGFHVAVWAEGFAMPRFLLQGEHGEILLADSKLDEGSASAC
ncbi:MAG TPA: hypothetical protein VFW83_08175 [Bryobacteraceae bacterium]|nr:hypothetical protein [Bryobacteraceae bacterium]